MQMPEPGDSEASLWPKHHRVYLVLCQQITDGIYSDEAPMPGDLALAQQFGVSRITIRKAMDRLTREGRVDRQRGRGTFVCQRPATFPVKASLSGNLENLIALGLETEVRVVDLVYAIAPPAVSAAMGLPDGAQMQRAIRVRSLDGVPFSHLTTWLPEAIGRSFTRQQLETTPLLQLIERSGHRIDNARQTITARLASPDVAQVLRIEPGDALLSVRRMVFDSDGRAVEWISGLYRPDTYEHEMSFDRSVTAAAKVWNA